MRVRFRDLSVSDPVRKAELLDAVERVLTHGQLLLGPEVERFEEAIAAACGTRYCVGMASGTDALYLALRSLGIGPGDEVITTPLSWVATLNAIHLCGAHPVFVDIGEDLNLDPSLIEGAITPRTKAIVPVHFTGRLCDMPAIMALAQRHRLLVIEDAAQAFGAHLDDIAAGAFGDAGAFSFNPMKVLPAYGEAGAVVTPHQEAYEKLLALRYQGTVQAERCESPSLNAKIDALQAAMLMVSLQYLEPTVQRRLEIAQAYSDGLREVVNCPAMEWGGGRPSRHRGGDGSAAGRGTCGRPSVFFDYTISADRRDALKAFLAERGIETKVKHPILMPHQPAYAHLPRGHWPVAERLVERILSLPIHEKLTPEDIGYVIESVTAFYRSDDERP